MSTIADITKALHTILHSRADQIAIDNLFLRRNGKPLSGSRFVRALVYTLLANPKPSIKDFVRTAAAQGLRISPQGFNLNFTQQAADLLAQVLQLAAATVVTANNPHVAGLLACFSAVLVFDASHVALPPTLAHLWPGCGNGARPDYGSSATLKFTLGIDYLRGQLFGFELLEGLLADSSSLVQQRAVPAGALRLADLGFFCLDRFATISAGGGLWFSRLRTATLFYTADGKKWELHDYLATKAGNSCDETVHIGAAKRLKGRLIAVRITDEAAAARRRSILKEAKDKCQAVSERRLAAADWNVYITNVGAELLNVDEALVLAGVRWQIELMFKLWKSHGEIDNLAASSNPWRILCAVYGKMLAMVLTHWLTVVSSWGGLAVSIVGAAKAVRQFSATLSVSRNQEQLALGIATISAVIQLTCQLPKRGKRRGAHELVQVPSLVRGLGWLA